MTNANNMTGYTAMSVRIGLISTAERSGLYTKVLKGEDFLVTTDDALMCNTKKTLSQWRRTNHHIAIIDGEAFSDHAAMMSNLYSFLLTPGPKEAPLLRLIYVADQMRKADDEDFSRLVQLGCYDFLIPSAGDSVESDLIERIKHPNAYAHVQGYDQKLPPISGVYVPHDPETVAPLSRYRAPATTTVGVVGSFDRVGTTSWAIVAARAVAKRGMEVACVLCDDIAFDSLRQQYECEIAQNGKSYRIDGVEYFHGSSEEDVIGRHDYIIFDLGVMNSSVNGIPDDSPINRHSKEFRRCDIKVVINDGSFSRFDFAKSMIAHEDPRDVECWHWGFFGIDDMYMNGIRAAFEKRAPKTNAFKVDYYPMPVISEQPIPQDVYKVLGLPSETQVCQIKRKPKFLGLF